MRILFLLLLPCLCHGQFNPLFINTAVLEVQAICGRVFDNSAALCAYTNYAPACQRVLDVQLFCRDVINRCALVYGAIRCAVSPTGVNPLWRQITPNTFYLLRSLNAAAVGFYQDAFLGICAGDITGLCQVLISLIVNSWRINGIPIQDIPGVVVPPVIPPVIPPVVPPTDECPGGMCRRFCDTEDTDTTGTCNTVGQVCCVEMC